MNEIFKKVRKGAANPCLVIPYIRRSASDYFRLITCAIDSEVKFGTNVYELDWDLLILLDTCRIDAIQQVSHNYNFIDNIDTLYSVGGSSLEWILRTFTDEHLGEINDTSYITSNAWAERLLTEDWHGSSKVSNHPGLNRLSKIYPANQSVPKSAFDEVDQVWKYGEEYLNHIKTDQREFVAGGTDPGLITDVAIGNLREGEYSRSIVHYIQPHHPYISEARKQRRDLKDYEIEPFDYIKQTDDKTTVWDAYISDLKYALDHVELLLENTNASKVIISADHGEAFGEYGVYGHHTGSLHPKIRRVPWITTEADDKQTHKSSTISSSKESDNIKDELEALGYL